MRPSSGPVRLARVAGAALVIAGAGTPGIRACPAQPEAAPAAAEALVEHWIGQIDVPDPNHRDVEVVLTLWQSPGEPWRAILDLPPGQATPVVSAAWCPEVHVQGARALLATGGDSPTVLEFERAGARATGVVRIGGVFEAPLSLTRAERATALERVLARPQEPRPPFPYRLADVRITSPADQAQLAGTATFPPGPGPHPAVALVGDFGPLDRDQAAAWHRPGAVLADAFARAGFATIRLDSRGTGASTGDEHGATLDVRAADVRAAVEHLAGTGVIDRACVGLVGLGEGCVVAALAAGAEPRPAFLVLLGPRGLPGAEAMVARDRARLSAEGESSRYIEARLEKRRAALDLALAGAPEDRLAAAARAEIEFEAEQRRGEGTAPEPWQMDFLVRERLEGLVSTKARDFLRSDPAPAYRAAADVPALVIAGELDAESPPADHLPVLREAFAGPRHRVESLAGLNHRMQPATTGFEDEMERLSVTVAPLVIDGAVAWARRHCERGGKAASAPPGPERPGAGREGR
ncbi:MAG TPA: alpha/beta hydrolase [Phycisphaerales bacterium]|nr:alpha/beta hydrolase [Phycisphaerales bacterium]